MEDLIDNVYNTDSFVDLIRLLDKATQNEKVVKARQLVSHAYTHVSDGEEEEEFDNILCQVVEILE